LSPLIHFSAGGQLLHPSEVNNSISEFRVSPLSKIVAGTGDSGMAAMLINKSGMLNLSQLAFMVADIAVAGAGINDPSYTA
jgi:hypothetical protein